MKLRLMGTKSRITVRTFAEGLFARLAHDLEIVAEGTAGQSEPTADAAAAASVTVRVPVRGLRVVGAVRDGRVDERTLSVSDRADIEERMRTGLAGDEVVVVATLVGTRARLDVRTPHGRQSVEVPVVVNRTEAGSVRASGTGDLSLRALGVPPVRGPAGAFRLADRVQVSFDATFEPDAETEAQK